MNVFEILGVFKIDKTTGLADLRTINSEGEKSAVSMSSAWGKVAAAVTAAFSIGVLVREFKGFVKDAVAAASEYEDAISDLATVMDPEAAAGLGASFRKLSEEIPITTEELAKIAETAAKLGIDAPADVEKFTASVAKISIATGESSEQVAKDFGKILTITGESADAVEGMGSAFGALSDELTVDSGELIDTVKKVADSFVSIGASTPDIIALAAEFQTLSATGKEAAAGLQGVVEAVKDPEKISDFALALGLTNDEFRRMRDEQFVELLGQIATEIAAGGEGSEKLAELLGTSAAKVEILGKNWDGVQSAVALANEQYKNASDLQQDYNTKSETFGAQLDILSNKFTNLKVDVGQSLVPAIEELIGAFDANREGIESFFTSLATGIANTFVWLAENGDTVVAMIEIIALAFAGMKIGSAIANIGSLAAAFNPLTIAIGATVVGFTAMGLNIARAIGDASRYREEIARGKRELEEWTKANEEANYKVQHAGSTFSGTTLSGAAISETGLVGSTFAGETNLSPSSLLTAGMDEQERQAALEAARRAEEARKRADALRAKWGAVGAAIRETFAYIKTSVNEAGEEIVELGNTGRLVADTLTGLFSDTLSSYFDQQKAHNDALQAVRDDEQTALEAAAEQRDADLADLEQQLADKLISEEEYNAQHQQILDEYVAAETAAHEAATAAQEAEEKSYKESKKTMWEILKESVRDTLTALRENLMLKAAAALGEAIALTLGLSPMAIPKYAEAAAYGVAAAGLAIAGFKQGGIATEEMLARIGDTGVNEAVIPLTATNLAEIGAGIAAASVVGGTSTTIGGTSLTVQINNPTVRSDADIRQIVTGVNDVLKRWERGQGRLAPVGA